MTVRVFAAGCAALAFFISCSLFAAGDVETPASLAGGKVISVQEAAKLAEKKAAAFIDTRSVVNFGKGHVPGAKAVAYKEKSDKIPNFDASQDAFDLSKLPADKGAKIVFYSDGPTGWKSFKAAVTAVKAGHKDVNYMRYGWTEWTAKGLPVEQ